MLKNLNHLNSSKEMFSLHKNKTNLKHQKVTSDFAFTLGLIKKFI